MVAPRVNAAGRMSTPDIATRLLLAADETMAEEARQLALQLDGENVRRQEEEAEILAAAKKIVQTDPDVGARSVLVVGGEGWHRGVIGIVASKLVDAFHRPAIVLSVDGDAAHGSCRSIPRFDMLAALERCAHLFLRFGGHKQAAGLTMEAGRIKELRLAINAVADETLGPDDLMPRLRIDGDLTFRGITGGVAAGVAALAPFGAGNPRPVFAARGVEIIDGPRKLKERHLKMALKQEGRIFRAIAWRAAERHDFLAEHKTALDVAFSLDQNQYNGETYVELTLADVRSSEPHSLTSSTCRRSSRLPTDDPLAASRPSADCRVRRDVRGLRRVSVQARPGARRRSNRHASLRASSSKAPAARSNGSTLSRQDVFVSCDKQRLLCGRDEHARRRDHRHRRAQRVAHLHA